MELVAHASLQAEWLAGVGRCCLGITGWRWRGFPDVVFPATDFLIPCSFVLVVSNLPLYPYGLSAPVYLPMSELTFVRRSMRPKYRRWVAFRIPGMWLRISSEGTSIIPTSQRTGLANCALCLAGPGEQTGHSSEDKEVG